VVRRRPVAFLALLAVAALSGEARAASPAACGPNDRLETGLQGQIPLADRVSGRSAEGYNCNLDEIGSFAGTAFANFDTYENCAYYSDTIGLYAAEGGTVVLDLADPRKPVQTDYLTAGPFRNAGESLRVNRKRGLLVADRYTIAGSARFDDSGTARSLAVYDVSENCRKPKLLANVVMPTAIGHEGCFHPDGMVYYMASTDTITPIDLSDPTKPKQLSEPWERGIHGCSVSDDGNRGYFADIGEGRLLIADTSQVQARKEGAEMHDLAHLPTPTSTGQQSTVPLSYGGRPFLLNWSEFTELLKPCTPGSGSDTNFGYPIMVDIADERNPKVVAKMQTEVMLPENCPAVLADSVFLTTDGLTAGDVFPVIGSRVFLYDSHYCSTDRLHDPTIAACASFGSGIRVYDIRDPRAPREIAYYNPGTIATPDGSAMFANAAVARPVIRSDLGQIWFPDAYRGFHVLQFRAGVWPFAGQDPCPHPDYYLEQYDLGYRDCRAQRKSPVTLPSPKVCRSRRDFTIHLRQPRRGRIRSARVYVDGKRVRVVRGDRLTARVDLRGMPKGRFTVRVVIRTTRGQTITRTRRYRTCLPRARGPRAAAVSAQSLYRSSQVAQRILALCRLAAARS
jgi:hypothetical protein